MKIKYPEHEKLKRMQVELELCGDFLEWLQTKYYMVDKSETHDNLFIQLGYSSYINYPKVLAEFFGINNGRIEKEKELMLEELRR